MPTSARNAPSSAIFTVQEESDTADVIKQIAASAAEIIFFIRYPGIKVMRITGGTPFDKGESPGAPMREGNDAGPF